MGKIFLYYQFQFSSKITSIKLYHKKNVSLYQQIHCTTLLAITTYYLLQYYFANNIFIIKHFVGLCNIKIIVNRQILHKKEQISLFSTISFLILILRKSLHKKVYSIAYILIIKLFNLNQLKSLHNLLLNLHNLLQFLFFLFHIHF